ncbi:Uncharacterized protein Fot_37284 [Forsythia ovata]|uniref:Uncharacterized protein n=1 Tax=Forsythia ovata TaxID=205694 RepID=A0ABD1RYK7_9LAMI
MKVISIPQFSGNGEMVELDVLIITYDSICLRPFLSLDYVADERRYSWLLERNNAQTSLLPTSYCAAGVYIHGSLKENNAKIVPLQNFEDLLRFLLTPMSNLTKSAHSNFDMDFRLVLTISA